MGDIWPLGEKYYKFKIKQILFLRNFSITGFQNEKVADFYVIAIDSQQYRRMLTFFYFHMVHL
jgi:hypothetical protein